MKKLFAILSLVLVLAGLSGCSGNVLDDDGTKHLTFINDMDVVVNSVTCTVDGTETGNLLGKNTELTRSDRTMLKIPAKNANVLTNVSLTVTDTQGVQYKFENLDVKNAGSLTFQNDEEGQASMVISS